jgi:hypothetical protein
MRYMEDKKGQGFDTFKLLIAAVVAMVILGIVTGVFNKIWEMIAGIQCVANPIGEITSVVQTATAGMGLTTQRLCFGSADDFITSDSIQRRLSGISKIGFKCTGAAVCDTARGQIDVQPDRITARQRAQFKIQVTCTERGGNFECDLAVVNPQT